MKKIITVLFGLLALIPLMLCGLVACGAGGNKVRVVEVTHSVFYAPLYIALEGGYFDDEGIEVELTNGGGADKCMTALLANQSDIGLMGVEACIYVMKNGKENYPKVISQLTRMDGSFIVGREKIENFTLADMHGKEILGGRRGGVPAMALEYALKQKGLINGDNVTINYDVQFDMIIPAFESGTGDFCTMFEPAASNFVKSGKGYILGSVGLESGNMPFTAFMAMQDFMSKHPDKVEKFLRAIIRAMDFLHSNDAEKCAEVLAKSFNTTDKALLVSAIDAYKRIGAYSVEPIMNREEFMHLQEVIISAGVLDSGVSYDDIVDNSYAEKVLAGLTN